MRKTTKTVKKQAVTSVFSLVRSGHSITNARKVIAKELNLSSTGNALWTWQKELGMVTPVITEVSRHSNNTVISRPNTVHSGISNMKSELGNVFTSLVKKDGRYTSKEAGAISQVSSNILGLARFELEVHKYADKATKRDKVVTNLLT
mgnify:CR=1 FL=1